MLNVLLLSCESLLFSDLTKYRIIISAGTKRGSALLFFIFFLLTAADAQLKRRMSFSNDSVFHNPLFVSDYPMADVTVFRGEDSLYYMFGSGVFNKQYLFQSRNLYEWESTDLYPISKDVQEGIANLKQPLEVEHPKIKSRTCLWAPHIVKVGKYYNLYTSVGSYGGIICLQSKEPTGPFEFARFDKMGNPVKLVDLRDVGMDFDVIDPCFVHDSLNKRNYLFFGSSFGIYRVELTKDGTRVKKKAQFVHVAGSTDRGKTGIDYEGTMIYKHGDYWYMILSPRRSYRLLCWRSKSLTGKFVDRNGNSPLSDKYGWEILQPQPRNYITPEGYHLAITGHSGEIIKDKQERYYIFCHASVSLPTKTNVYGHRAACLTEIAWDEEGWPHAVTFEHRVSYENRKPAM